MSTRYTRSLSAPEMIQNVSRRCTASPAGWVTTILLCPGLFQLQPGKSRVLGSLSVQGQPGQWAALPGSSSSPAENGAPDPPQRTERGALPSSPKPRPSRWRQAGCCMVPERGPHPGSHRVSGVLTRAIPLAAAVF